MPTLISTAKALASGAAAVAGVGKDTRVTVAGTWATGDKATVFLTDSASGNVTQIGAGQATGIVPTFVFVYKNRVYVLAGTKVFFCAIGDATVWNSPTGIGNSYIVLSDFFAAAQDTQAIANYQGKLAFLSRENIQIWNVDPDPTAFAQVQVLENMGTFAAQSVQSIGDLDTMFMHDTGIRSLRVRDSSNNAFVVDIGSPIDELVQAKIQSSTTVQQAAACAVVEPSSNRYWCFLKDLIYVLSYFPTSKISAWSTYEPTYSAGPSGSVVVTITGGSVGGLRLRAPNDAGAMVDLTVPAGVVFNTNTTQTATDLAQAIVDNSAATGYGVVADGNTVVIYPNASGTSLIATLAITQTGVGGNLTTTVVDGFATPFVPQNFVTYRGQVYVRTSDALYQYGGTTNIVYDGCVAQGETSFLSLQTPGTKKETQTFNCVSSGSWEVYVSSDPISGLFGSAVFKNATQTYKSTYDINSVPYAAYGTHFKFKFITTGSTAAKVSAMSLTYKGGGKQ